MALKVDEQLDSKTVTALTWKPSALRNICRTIVDHFVTDRIAYADDVPLEWVQQPDRNCIGLAWRMMTEAGILAWTGRSRRSGKDSSRGRRVFQYLIASDARANTFLARNGYTTHVQPPQTIVLHALDGGDRSVGIQPTDETVTITFEGGGWPDDLIEDATKEFKELLGPLMDVQKVMDDLEYRAMCESEAAVDREIEEHETRGDL